MLRVVPSWRAGCLGFAVLAVLGFALNDSGITVPGIMLVVFVAAWVHLVASVPPEAPPRPVETVAVDAPPAPSREAVLA